MKRWRSRIGRTAALGLISLATLAFALVSVPRPLSGATPWDGELPWLQEALGQAVVSAAMAQTTQEKAQAQEVLGALLVLSSSPEPVLIPPGSNAETNFVPPGWHETQGESGILIFAALGGTVMLLISFLGIRSESAPPLRGRTGEA